METNVALLIVEMGYSDDSRRRRTAAREKVLQAATSGNADALLMMGFQMRSAQGTDRQLQGAAWMCSCLRLARGFRTSRQTGTLSRATPTIHT